MPPSTSSADERLIGAYQEAALRINRLLQEARSPADRKRVLARINELLNELDQMTADYLQTELPLKFKEGSDEAITELRKTGGFDLTEEFTSLHREALQALADDATQKFASALQGVRQNVMSAIKRAQKDQIVRELIASEIEGAGAPQKRVKILLEDQGIKAIQGRGRSWTLEDYSAMLTHTVLADAHNTGAATRYISNGVEYAQVIERADAPDDVCHWMRGKIIWLGDSRLRNPYHPRCYGGLKPWFGDTSEAIRSADDPRIPAQVRATLLKR